MAGEYQVALYLIKKNKKKNTLARSHDRLVQLQVAASTFGTVAMETAALPASLPAACLPVCLGAGTRAVITSQGCLALNAAPDH